MKKVIIVTRKIELRYNSSNKEERSAFYKTIKNWQKICYKAANQISSQLFWNLNQEDFQYITEKGKKVVEDRNFFKDMTPEERKKYFDSETKEIYKTIAEEQKEMISGTLQNNFYQLLSRRYLTECPSSILTALNQRVFKAFTENKKMYLDGTKSIASYKSDYPIPFQSANIVKVRSHIQDGKETKDFAFTLFGHPLRTNFGLDLSNNAKIMKDAFSAWFLPKWIWDHELRLSDYISTMEKLNETIELQGKTYHIEAVYEKEKIFYYKIKTTGDYSFRMMAAKKAARDENGELIKNEKGRKVSNTVYKIVSNVRLLDSTIQLSDERFEDKNGQAKEITRIFLLATLEFEKEKNELSEDMIAYATLSPEQPITVKINEKEFLIGSKDDFVYRRRGIEGAYRKRQRDMKGAQGGRGRKHKLQALENYKGYEARVVTDKLHKYSQKLIKLCKEYECKYLHLELIKLSEEELKQKELIIRYWTPAKLTEFINYKAEKAGIVVS